MGPTVMLAGFLLAIGQAGAAQFDPTSPPPVAQQPADAAAPPAPELAWVRVAGKHSIAWYGGRVVHLGESVDGGRVVAIREDRIEIQRAGERQVIPLWRPVTRVQRR